LRPDKDRATTTPAPAHVEPRDSKPLVVEMAAELSAPENDGATGDLAHTDQALRRMEDLAAPACLADKLPGLPLRSNHPPGSG
jgi:hypothetical protein